MLLGPQGTKVDIGIKRGSGISVTIFEVVRGGGSMSQAPLLGIGMGFKHKSSNGGFIVTNVQPGGPAEKAGVQSDDLICMYNGENLALKHTTYLNEMLSSNSDPIVRFGVRRGDVQNIISVVVIRTPLNGSQPWSVRQDRSASFSQSGSVSASEKM